MRTLLQRASYLFWQYPRLWLPVILADMLKYWVLVAGRTGERAARLALTPHSVLGGQLEPPRGFAQTRIAAATGAITLPADFIGVVLYMAALGIIVHSLSQMEADHNGVLRLQWAKPAKLFRYSAAMSFRCLLAAMACLFVLGLQLRTFRFNSHFLGQPVIYGFTAALVVLCTIVAYSPIRAFVLSNLMPLPAVAPPVRTGPRVAATVVILAFSFLDYLLGYFLNLVINPFQSAHPQLGPYLQNVMLMLTSLITAIPFIFGMILFILIVQQEVQESAHIFHPLESPVDESPNSL